MSSWRRIVLVSAHALSFGGRGAPAVPSTAVGPLVLGYSSSSATRSTSRSYGRFMTAM
jgi:hypothetical protein